LSTRRAATTGAPQGFAVACSAGPDSLALLHACLRVAKPLGLEVHALHVQHGLLPQAQDWLNHLQTLCGRWARAGWPLSFDARALSGKPGKGESVEAWARRERYAAITEMAHAAGLRHVLLAHHARDQAETFLLQALRGAGPAGLSGMPVVRHRDGLIWLRPWLKQAPRAIDAYVRRHRLQPVLDPSNSDARFARSRLREAVMPALTTAFPEALTTLGAAAEAAQDATQCLLALAELDLQLLRQPSAADVAGASLPALSLAQLMALPRARQRNVLRHWLKPVLPGGVPNSLVARLVDELPGSRSGRWPLGQGQELRPYRGWLRCLAEPRAPAAPAPEGGVLPDGSAPPPVQDLRRIGMHGAPGGGTLRVRPCTHGGIATVHLQQAQWRQRSGGERFALHAGAASRSLKKQFQSLGLAPDERTGPLLFNADGLLLFVPGLGMNARALAEPGQAQRRLEWHHAPRNPKA
jgi:tRNA(Ile)-lysidine synthase